MKIALVNRSANGIRRDEAKEHHVARGIRLVASQPGLRMFLFKISDPGSLHKSVKFLDRPLKPKVAYGEVVQVRRQVVDKMEIGARQSVR